MMAMAAEEKDTDLICPMIDARRMEVYCQVVDKTLNAVQGVEAKIIDEQSFSEFLKKKKVIFFWRWSE